MVAPICIHGPVGVAEPAGAGHHMEDGPVGVRHGAASCSGVFPELFSDRKVTGCDDDELRRDAPEKTIRIAAAFSDGPKYYWSCKQLRGHCAVDDPSVSI